MKKKNFRLLLLFAAIVFTTALRAQVTIGDEVLPQDFSVLELISNDSKGLRLPQMSTHKRDSITSLTGFKTNALANGLTIYNTTIDCVETWNGIKKEWVSLCGSGALTLTPDPGNDCDTIPADGDCAPTYTVDDPQCNMEGEYTFTWIAGEDYAYLNILDAFAGLFLVGFDPNDQAIDRNAIVMITSPCGNSGIFVFTQKGDQSLCNPGATAPKIASENGESLCGSGAVYLYLTSDGTTRISGTGYVWTWNGQEVARDTASYIARSPGKYIVYSGAIGCTTPKPDTVVVTRDNSGAPNPVAIIVGANNGLVCSAGDEITLFASVTGSGNIVWYKNGVKQQGKTGTQITAGIGVWFAVVEDGSCSSIPSNSITVALDPNSGNDNIASVTFKVNGSLPGGNSVTLCAGGSLLLEVQSPHPQTDVTYSWYAGDKQNGILLGTGATLITTVAAIQNYPIMQCVASKAGSCTKSKYLQISISTSNPPDHPSISNASGQYLCGGTASLTASSPGAASYIWYKDGVVISGQTTATLTVTATGTYTVYGQSGTCVSPVSDAFTIIGNSGYGTVSIKEDGTTVSGVGGLTANSATAKTLTAVINPNGAETYSWTIATTGSFIPAGNATPLTATGSSVTLNLPTVLSGAATVTATVVATNACTPSATASATYTVNPLCVEANATNFGYSPATKTAEVLPGYSTTLSITPNGDPSNFTYSWRNAAAAGTEIGTNQSCTVYAGTYYCLVTATCGGSAAQSADFTVTIKDPATLALGSGTITGRTCFDIDATTADGLTAAQRAADYPANFTQANVYHQVYTFTSSASSTFRNLRYVIVDAEGAVDSHSGSGLTSGNFGNNNTATISIDYKQTLNRDDSSPRVHNTRRRANPVQVKVYVVYNNGTDDVQVSLTANIQDGACCGANVSGTWKAFMCHNMGADHTADPFTPSRAINGNYYQWGQNTPARTSSVADDATPATWPKTNKSVYYGDKTSSMTVTTKSPYDPCPAGYRVPSYNEWDYLCQNNAKTNKPTPWPSVGATSWSGSWFGQYLFLPAAGERSGTLGELDGRGSRGGYWSTRLNVTNGAYHMGMKEISASVGQMGLRSYGLSVRCIAQ